MGEGDSRGRESLRYVFQLDELDRSKGAEVGSKAAGLGDMMKVGLPVPLGFAITGKAFIRFLDFNKIKSKVMDILSNVNIDDSASLRSASDDITNLIMKSRLPDFVRSEIWDAYEELSVGKEIRNLGGAALDMIKAGRGQVFVAVRSSVVDKQLASADFTGQFFSTLSVQGKDQLQEAIKKCYASLFSTIMIPKMKSKLNDSKQIPSLAIVVQKMVDADKSGFLFTSNPFRNSQHGGAENQNDQVMVEATWGYGDALVSGLVIPDEYLIDKNSGQALGKKIGKKKWIRRMNPISGLVVTENTDRSKVAAEILNEHELAALFKLGNQVEAHWNTPQDIEWASSKGRLFIVQSRPIVKMIMKPDAGHDQEHTGQALLSGIGASPGSAIADVKVISSQDEVSHVDNNIEGNILVTKMTSPSMVPLLRRAAAVITNDGGKVCHAAVVSRELGIPCIVGTDMATTVLNDGQKISVNANNGKVFDYVEPVTDDNQTIEANPTATSEQASTQASSNTEEGAGAADSTQPSLPSMTSGSDKITATEIKVNLSFPHSIENSNDIVSRVDGAGLVRAEHMLTESGRHPEYVARTNPNELVDSVARGLGKVAKAFYPKPVWYRNSGSLRAGMRAWMAIKRPIPCLDGGACAGALKIPRYSSASFLPSSGCRRKG
jgi:pyruvate,water dikinase